MLTSVYLPKSGLNNRMKKILLLIRISLFISATVHDIMFCDKQQFCPPLKYIFVSEMFLWKLYENSLQSGLNWIKNCASFFVTYITNNVNESSLLLSTDPAQITVFQQRRIVLLFRIVNDINIEINPMYRRARTCNNWHYLYNRN